MLLKISPSQLKLWSECREKHRIGYLLKKEKTEPSIHLQFGRAIHRMAQNYWAGKDYMRAFHAALMESQALDPRLLTAANQTKYTALCENIAPITTVYYGFHGDKAIREPAQLNEQKVEWVWGTYEGVDVILSGILDRVSHRGVLLDTKTASAVGKDWKGDLKKRLLREPQMGFYLRYLEECSGGAEGIQYEVIVKPYRGSEPQIVMIDVTKEVKAFQKVFVQQMDWTIREMCQFYAQCPDAAPWPMSNTACVNMWGECEFLPVCSGKTDLEDEKLYQIKKEKEEVEV